MFNGNMFCPKSKYIFEQLTLQVNCSNMYFGFGQIILPLNIPVEVRQGHINVLKEVKIPRHIQVGDNLSAVKMMPRYSISFEDMKA